MEGVELSTYWMRTVTPMESDNTMSIALVYTTL